MTKEQKQQQQKDAEFKIMIQTYIDNMFYNEDFDDFYYTEDTDTINKRVEEFKEYIEEVDLDNDFKERILKNNLFLGILGHFDITEMLNQYSDTATVDRINELAQDFDHIHNFFKDVNAFKILELYGEVIDKDDNGFYKLSDNMVNNIIQRNDFYIKDTDKIKGLIFDNWENQKEIITPETLNDYSKKRNGIDFKYFLFCEEFIKTGKITDVAKNLGIGRRTCYDYLQKKEVKEYLKERQDEIRQENTDLMKQRYNECFNILYGLGNKEYTTDEVKIKAIDTYLKHYTNSVLKKDTTE